MKYLGSKTLETKRLTLKAQTMKEQKRLWEILMIPEVNKYFLTIPKKYKNNLKNWDKQKEFYEAEIEHAKDSNVFQWSIFLKDTDTCIGRITCYEKYDESKSRGDEIYDVGWIIDPAYQGQGYGSEAAKAMIDYMFFECEINEIRTGAAICNPSSWKIMEKLGFERQKETKMIEYTFLDELTEIYLYQLTKEKYMLFKEQ